MDTLLQAIPKPYLTALSILGALSLSAFLLKTARVLLQTFVLPGTSLKTFGAGNGAWALVTGATDGIGREFAAQLAGAGFNVILVSRSADILRSAADEIQNASGAQTRTLAIDFSAPTESQYTALADLCAELPVSVLVNNVGRSHEMPVAFAETPLAEQQAIIDINVTATLRVTRIAIRGMLERKRGLVLTLSSFAGAVPSPLLATYSASKAFLQTWSDALHAELSGSGITVECVSTYFVVSNMSRIRRASALIPTPRAYVRSVLAKIALPCGALSTGRPSTSTPFWSHALLDYAMHAFLSPRILIAYTHRLHKDIRRRALRKKERDALAAKKQ